MSPDHSIPVFLTAESVTEGHPDKVADRISDAVLDAHIARDPLSRVACDAMLTRNRVFVSSEVTSDAAVIIEDVVRKCIREIGFDRPEEGFSADSCEVRILIHPQNEDISRSVDTGGAGDQGVMVGYACDDTEELMPLPIALSHALTRRLTNVRRTGILPWLRPDGEAQVTVRYTGTASPQVTSVVLSAQHEEHVKSGVLKEALVEEVIRPVLGQAGDPLPGIHINPTGRFVIGGPMAGTGLTGRKIIVDCYGSAVPHGGGAFSGKDPSKVDRSAAYMARLAAKSLVAWGQARKATVHVSYAFGKREPLSINVDSHGTSAGLPDYVLRDLVVKNFPFNPDGIIEFLDLLRPIYTPLSSYGHFGREEEGLGWEQVPEPAS
jgi:S-adenosylmethionine synthetase